MIVPAVSGSQRKGLYDLRGNGAAFPKAVEKEG